MTTTTGLTSEAITNDPAGNNGTVSYVYDPVGNRFSMTSTLSGVPGGTFSYVFPLFSYVSIASQSLASPFGSASGQPTSPQLVVARVPATARSDQHPAPSTFDCKLHTPVY